MNQGITESVVENAALDWLAGLGYEVLSGLVIAPGEAAAVAAKAAFGRVARARRLAQAGG